MTARKKAPVSLLKGKKASVYIERNGLSIRVDDVPAEEAGLIAADLVAAMRVLRQAFSELTPDLQPVGGYHPLDTMADDWADDGRRRTGFTVTKP
jgi:hypothetical protein